MQLLKLRWSVMYSLSESELGENGRACLAVFQEDLYDQYGGAVCSPLFTPAHCYWCTTHNIENHVFKRNFLHAVNVNLHNSQSIRL